VRSREEILSSGLVEPSYVHSLGSGKAREEGPVMPLPHLLVGSLSLGLMYEVANVRRMVPCVERLTCSRWYCILSSDVPTLLLGVNP